MPRMVWRKNPTGSAGALASASCGIFAGLFCLRLPRFPPVRVFYVPVLIWSPYMQTGMIRRYFSALDRAVRMALMRAVEVYWEPEGYSIPCNDWEDMIC